MYWKGDDGNAKSQMGTIECTMLARNSAPSTTRNLVSLSATGSADNRMHLRVNTSQQEEIFVRSGAADQVNAAGATDICDDASHVVRARYRPNSVFGLLDGASEVAEDTSCAIPSIDRIHVGEGESGIGQSGPDVWVKNVRLKGISTNH